MSQDSDSIYDITYDATVPPVKADGTSAPKSPIRSPSTSNTFNATNATTAIQSFRGRTLYDAYAYSPSFSSTNIDPYNARDFWYSEEMLYGRVDNQYDPVYPNPKFLSTLKGEGRTETIRFQALDFVVSSFNKMSRTYDNSVMAGKISASDMSLSKLAPVKAYESPQGLYTNHLLLLGELFVEQFMTSERKSYVQDVKTFMKMAAEFLTHMSIRFPISRSSFITSNIASPLSSGLVIEISDTPYDRDQQKIEKFISSPNFNFYRDTAKQYGFLIDKNIPWRLVADLESPKMLGECCVCREQFRNSIASDIQNSQDVFNTYYLRTYDKDLYDFKNLLLMMYNKFVDAFPNVSKSYEKDQCIVRERSRRTPINISRLEQEISEEQILNLFIKIRSLETKMILSDKEIGRIVKNALSLKISVDEARMISYINKKFNTFQIFRGSTMSYLQNSQEQIQMEERRRRFLNY